MIIILWFSGVGVVDGLLYAVGGHDGPLVRNSVEVYNPDTNAWNKVANMHLCRRNAGKEQKNYDVYTTVSGFAELVYLYRMKLSWNMIRKKSVTAFFFG
jgi:hypothetical protein